jgi:hypothetical protein
MTAPTPDEIKAGYDAITRDGPAARITGELGLLAIRDPLLRGTLDRMVKNAIALGLVGDHPAGLQGTLSGALIYGLHLGLHIGESRRPPEKP